MLITQKKDHSFLLNFNKIFINSKNLNTNFYFLTNNFFLLNNFNIYSFIFENKNYFNFINNFKKIKITTKKNINLFFKKNNKYRNFIFFFKYLFKFKFKFNRLFYYFFINKKKIKYNFFLNTIVKYKETGFFNKFNNYFKYFFRNWSFLIGYPMNAFLWDLHVKKNWIRKDIKYNLKPNRYFFKKLYKSKIQKKKFNLKLKIYKLNHKKYILNNFFYFRNFYNKKSPLNYNLKLNIFTRFFKNKKKNYNLFLSKPYLFLNTYKNFKLRKYFSNYFLISLYKKYFRFFRVLKRINFHSKFKKTNNIFFMKILSNPNIKTRSLRNKHFQPFLKLKSNYSFFKYYSFFKIKKFSKKSLKKKLNYFFFLKMIKNTKLLKKNKWLFLYKVFLNKKIILMRNSRRFRKKITFIRIFKIFTNLIKLNFFSNKLNKFNFKFKKKPKLKSKLKFKQKLRLKFKLKLNVTRKLKFRQKFNNKYKNKLKFKLKNKFKNALKRKNKYKLYRKNKYKQKLNRVFNPAFILKNKLKNKFKFKFKPKAAFKIKIKFKYKYKYKYKFNSFSKSKSRYKFGKLFLKSFFFKKLSYIDKKTPSYLFKWSSLIFFKFNKLKKINKLSVKRNFYFNIKNIKKIKKSNIWFKTKKPFFLTKNKLNFSFKFYGFLFLNNNIFNFFINRNKFYSIIKKNLYSFSYKNEIEKFILRRYAKKNYLFETLKKNNVFFKNIKSTDKFNNYNFLNFNTNIFSQYKLDEDFFFSKLFSKTPQLALFTAKNLSSFTNWFSLNTKTQYFKNTRREKNDFTLKRVRFKPGYMTIWRDVRNVLKNSLSLTFRYQHRLTNYLNKYNKFVNFKTFLIFEMRLLNILIKSRLLNDLSLSNSFINNNLVYVNGLLSNNKDLQIFIGDFIQLIINLKYYILSKWFLSLNLKRKNKIRKVFRKKNSNYNRLEDKKRSYNMPKWILFNKNLFDDCPNYLEIDYFTLSIFVIYEPFLWSDINPYNLIEQKFSIINLYNWKYIT